MARSRPPERIPQMERFAVAIVTGGIALVAGLWLVTLFKVTSAPWLFGGVLVVLGLGSLGWGIWTEIDI